MSPPKKPASAELPFASNPYSTQEDYVDAVRKLLQTRNELSAKWIEELLEGDSMYLQNCFEKQEHPAAAAFEIFITPSADASKAVVRHPCNAWASSAGYESWQSALAAMRDGKVICGSQFAVSPPGAKTVMGMQLFMEQVAAETLHSLTTEDGSLMVGLKCNFPAELLAEQEARMKDFREELRAMMSPRN